MFAEILLAFLLFLHVFVLKLKISHKLSPSPPGPSRLPLVGNLHQLNQFTSRQRSLWKLSKVHGPIMSIHFGCKPSIIISSGGTAKEIIKHHDLVFSSRPSLYSLQKLSYNCVDIAFAPYDDYWKQIRKICVLNLFSPKIVQSFRNIREDSVRKMTEKIKISSANSRQDVNLSEDILYLTSSVICKIAFGKDYVSEDCKEIDFNGLLGETQAVLGSFWFADFFPLGQWIDKFRGISSRLARVCKELDGFYEKMIQEHVEIMKEKKGDEKNEDMIDLLLKLKEDESSSLKLNFDHIKAVLMNIFIGATDTNAATLIWAMTLLIKNPRVMKKIQEELRLAIGKQGFVYQEDLPKLPYLKAIIKETLRLHPPAPLLLPRETTQWCKINGYAIKPKTLVYFNAWAIGRDPECWDNPLEFFPERFLDRPVDKGQEFGFMAFGGGRRSCPGMTMAFALVELALANLLYSFDWKLPEGMQEEDVETEAAPGIVMHKKVPLYLMAKTVP